MGAEELRRAAAEMRAKAGAATPTLPEGGWEAFVLGSEGYSVLGLPREGRRARTFVARCGMNDWDTDKQNAEHIAAWHPGVAESVALLLNAVASELETADYTVESDVVPTWLHSHIDNIAAAFMRGQS